MKSIVLVVLVLCLGLAAAIPRSRLHKDSLRARLLHKNEAAISADTESDAEADAETDAEVGSAVSAKAGRVACGIARTIGSQTYKADIKYCCTACAQLNPAATVRTCTGCALGIRNTKCGTAWKCCQSHPDDAGREGWFNREPNGQGTIKECDTAVH